MRDAERVPEDDISIGDALGTVSDPGSKASGWLTGGLSDVVASGPELVIRI
jgi:hypothetical protein